MTIIESRAAEIQIQYGIRSLHIFAQGPNWRVFASRGSEKFQASVEEGRGPTIASALENLAMRLAVGPINCGPLPDLIQAEGGSP